jgi:hypothetical protein
MQKEGPTDTSLWITWQSVYCGAHDRFGSKGEVSGCFFKVRSSPNNRRCPIACKRSDAPPAIDALAVRPGEAYFRNMSVMRESQRRVRAEKALSRYDPCLPKPAKVPPSSPGWIHEIKHDGFRIIAQRDGKSTRLLTRNGGVADRRRFPI